MSEIGTFGSHLLDPSLPKRRGRPSNAVVAARAAMLAAAQPKPQAQAFKKQQLARQSSASSSEDDFDDITLIAETDRICRTKLWFDFDPFSSDDDPFRSMPSTSQLLIQDDDDGTSSSAPSPHKLSWEDSPMTYPDDDYPYEDTPTALVARPDSADDDQSAAMDLEEVLDPALLAENDSQNDAQIPHNLKKWDMIPPTSFRWTRESMDLPRFSPRRYATKGLQRKIIMSVGSYYPSYPAHPYHHLHHHQPPHPHPLRSVSKTRPLPPPLLALPASKFRGPGMYPGIAKTRLDSKSHP